MPRKGARQRISYVLPLAESTAGHRLGVNGLAIDEKGGILYSGGRDGVVCAWDLNLLSSPSLDYARKPTKGSTFRTQVQAHTHWVNDIIVSTDGQNLVSASSDLTVKLWRPHSHSLDTPQTIGRHSDYVKCLAAPGSFNWIASGGLDRKIRLWDVQGGGEQSVIDVGDDGENPKGSVYALGVGGHGGSVLASGGPESVVRVWDPRSGERITKFVGHTDNIRSILVSEYGDLILTASSDTTVKLWSLAERRCIHTLSHHNDSVWSLFSSHPRLEVFHSSDRSGLVAKSDLRNSTDLDEGISVAVCQENEGVSRVIASGDNIWTATSSSSINRWSDVDTDTEVVKTRDLQSRSHKHRPSGSSVLGSPILVRRPNIPVNALLRLSSTGSVPSNVRDPDAVTVYSVSSQRRASIPDGDLGLVVPLNQTPEETIQGHHGLIKHFILNDRRRVLTVDTAGDVVLWDLLKCCQVKSFGRRELEDVAAEINTPESVANWCTVNTRTGALTCVLDETTCFDAEMYADQVELENPVDFREDQRINLGKWVLRYLFAELISEEIARDEQCRRTLDTQRVEREAVRRANAPPQITLPPAGMFDNGPPSSRSLMTPRANGHSHVPQTPALQIGLATPGPFMTPSMLLPNHTGNSSDGSATGRSSFQANRPAEQKDYFNSGNGVDHGKSRSSQDIPENSAVETPTNGTVAETSLFGKFRQSLKKGARSMSTDSRIPPPPTAITKAVVQETDSSSTHSSNKDKEDPNAVSEEILAGILQRQRQLYENHLNAFDKKEMLKSAITPSLPTETPLLRPPGNTMVIIQEDKSDSGGASDLYRGTVASCGKDAEILERVVPAWLGDLLLYNKIPFKEPVKISFVLVPWHEDMPSISSTADGYVGDESEGLTALSDNARNTRLNANRMLRARKIMAYVAERLPFSHLPELSEKEGGPRPEEWLELMCHDKPLDPLQTLATIRAHIWKTGGDILLQYRKKGDVKLGRAFGHQTAAPKRHSGSDSFSSDRDPMSPI